MKTSPEYSYIDVLEYMQEREDDYNTPQKMLDYLSTDADSRSIGDILRQTIITAAGLPQETTGKDCMGILYTHLMAQEEDLSDDLQDSRLEKDPDRYRKSLKEKISRWFKGSVLTIDDRDMVIKICFALGLNYKQSIELLNALGHSNLNIRDPKEATYIYCLAHRKSLKDAFKILERSEEILKEKNLNNTRNNGIEITSPVQNTKTENNAIRIAGKVIGHFSELETADIDNAALDEKKTKKHCLRLFINDKEIKSIPINKDKTFETKYYIDQSDFGGEISKDYIIDIKGLNQDGSIIINASVSLTYYKPSGNTTTLYLEQILSDTYWSNDEEFINSFLVAKHKDLFRYSTSAVLEYCRVKNELYAFIIQEELKHEIPGVLDRHELIYYDSKEKRYFTTSNIPIKDIQITVNFVNALNNQKDRHPILCKAYSDLKLDPIKMPLNGPDVMDQIVNAFKEYLSDISAQETLAEFYSTIINEEMMLLRCIDSLKEKPGEQYKDGTPKLKRDISESKLKNSILSNFVSNEKALKFEEFPGELALKTATRKSLILLCYLNFSLRDYQYIYADLETDSYEYVGDFEYFVNDLQILLDKCGFVPLDPRNKFDFLILKSVHILDEGLGDYYNENEYMDFFNDVLRLSFPSYYGSQLYE